MVIPTEAGRRFFPSFVRERVGQRTGGISLRSLAQATPIVSSLPEIPLYTSVLQHYPLSVCSFPVVGPQRLFFNVEDA